MTELVRFTDELSRLEEIVRALEAEELDLDRAIELYSEGVERLKRARALLAEAELKVKTLGGQLD